MPAEPSGDAAGDPALPAAPDYDGAHLRHVMTSAAASLGLAGFDDRLGLPQAAVSVVLLVDGLGDEQLARHTGHARFLASRWRRGSAARTLDSTAPATTAAGIASLATGRTPGEHGLVGYDVYSPELDRVVNMLGGWDPEVDPRTWQPHPSVLRRAEEAGASVLTVSRPRFADSRLTEAVLEGGRFRGANRLEARFTAALEEIREHLHPAGGVRRGPPQPMLLYLYVDELDKAGHQHGVDSAEWIAALESLDAEAERLVAALDREVGDQVSVLLTADHGMIDVDAEDRLDLAEHPELLDGVVSTAGEPRLLQLRVATGDDSEAVRAERRTEVADRWRRELGDRAWVLEREEAIDAGWFGDVSAAVRERLGDVVVALRDSTALFDTGRIGTGPLDMVGQHGSLTREERAVPLVLLSAGSLG